MPSSQMTLRFLNQSLRFFVILTAALFLLEGLVRIFYPQKVTPNYREPAFGIQNSLKANYQVDRNNHRDYPPYSIQTNRNRVRHSQDISYKKPPNTYRVLFLGDSVFFGPGVNNDELFTRHLENLLNQNVNVSGKRFEVINAGTPGWGLLQFLTYFKNEGYKYSPDLVVVSSYPDDIRQSFVDYFRWENLEYADGVIHFEEAQFELLQGLPIHALMNWFDSIPGYEWASRRSHLLNLIRFRLSALKKTPKINLDLKNQSLNQFLKTIDYKGYHSVTWKFNEFELKLPQFKNNVLEFFSRWSGSDPMIAEANLPLYFFAWHQLFKSIQNAGAQPLVLEVPAHDEVLQMTRVNRSQPFLDLFPGVSELDLSKPLKYFQTHIPVPLFFPWDNHWSPAGHRLIAQLIYNFMAQPESILSPRISLQSKDIHIPEMTTTLEQVNSHIKHSFDASYYLLFLEGMRLRNQSQIKQAADMLERYLGLRPSDYEGHFQLGVTYMIAKDFNRALPHLKQAQLGHILEQKKYKYTYTFVQSFGQAWRLFQEEHYKEALLFLDQAEILQGVYLDKVYSLKAEIFLRQKNFEYAKIFFEKATALNPGFYGNHQNLGTSYFAAGQFQKAASAYEKSLELNSQNLKTYLMISMAYKQLGQNQKSLKWFQKLFDRCGNSCEKLLREWNFLQSPDLPQPAGR